eukprot:c6230_g1_i1 orf=731-1315(+)
MADYGSPLAPIVDPRYCLPFPVELTVSKKVISMSGGSFEITDPEDNLVFKMDGHFFSIKDKRVLQDPEGCPIAVAEKKLITMHHRWEVAAGEKLGKDNELFTVRKSKVVQLKTNLDVFLAGNSSDTPDFYVKGNFFERTATVYQGDQVIAEVKRKFTVGNVLIDKHTFVVAISPYVDQAFIATLIIVMDAIHEE